MGDGTSNNKLRTEQVQRARNDRWSFVDRSKAEHRKKLPHYIVTLRLGFVNATQKFTKPFYFGLSPAVRNTWHREVASRTNLSRVWVVPLATLLTTYLAHREEIAGRQPGAFSVNLGIKS